MCGGRSCRTCFTVIFQYDSLHAQISQIRWHRGFTPCEMGTLVPKQLELKEDVGFKTT
jgi:hypothetical protein